MENRECQGIVVADSFSDVLIFVAQKAVLHKTNGHSYLEPKYGV